MRLDTLDPGARFLAPFSGLSGTVERVGVAGVRVVLDRRALVTVGGTSFERPERAILAGGCEVNLIHGEG